MAPNCWNVTISHSFSTLNFISEHIYSSYSHTSYVTKAEGLGSHDLKMTYTAIGESKKALTDFIGSGAQPSSLSDSKWCSDAN